jgi:thiol:disulfide interchange protein DsbD
MMKKLTVTLVLAFMAVLSFAQESPVKWTSSAQKVDGGQYKVTITASVPAPWHIYSQNIGDGGPVPTSFTFTKNPLLTLVGKTKESGKMQTVHDKNFDMDVKYYADKVSFTQLVKVKGGVKTNLSGEVNFMVCNDHECLPPSSSKFSVALK